jgi:pimeloyl-ACP methyl ester carboxylesterase
MTRNRATPSRVRGAVLPVLLAAATLMGAATTSDAATGCVDLKTLQIPPAEITLPTRGASISSSQLATVPADPATPGATRQYCKVVGAIAPVDPNAPPINFEVNLPVEWNGKAVQYGGGGSNGTLVTGLGPLRDARRDTPVPIARGFATWGTDSGHQNEKLSEPRAFALNDESFVNMAYASYKKTYDVARRLVQAFYDRAPSRIYFYGGSEGGREALMMAQRFPAAFDGIVSVVPVAHYVGGGLARLRLSMLQRDGGWINPAKVKLIHGAVIAACDRLDGLEDGVISAYDACTGVFDVGTLRCPGGADAGDTCLSDRQIAVDRMIHSPFQYPFPLKHGVTSFPGWNYGGEDQPGGMVDAVTGSEAPQFPIMTAQTQSDAWITADAFSRLYYARDPKFNTLQFSPAQFAARIREVSELFDATDPDLSAFLKRGGKLILKGNGADYTRSLFQEVSYYNAVVAKMGQAQVDSFIRFYVTPGVSHGGEGVMRGGAPVPSDVDLLGALDEWADGGNAPGVLAQVTQERDAPFRVTASRPMCRYPEYPRYKGQGDPTAASSFVCTKQ